MRIAGLSTLSRSRLGIFGSEFLKGGDGYVFRSVYLVGVLHPVVIGRGCGILVLPDNGERIPV